MAWLQSSADITVSLPSSPFNLGVPGSFDDQVPSIAGKPTHRIVVVSGFRDHTAKLLVIEFNLILKSRCNRMRIFDRVATAAAVRRRNSTAFRKRKASGRRSSDGYSEENFCTTYNRGMVRGPSRRLHRFDRNRTYSETNECARGSHCDGGPIDFLFHVL